MKVDIRKKQDIEIKLNDYIMRFECFINDIDIHKKESIITLEKLIDDYSAFILCSERQQQFKSWVEINPITAESITKQLQELTAQCVKLIENARAKSLIEGNYIKTNYFDNIEHCIYKEFGQFSINSNDTVLLIGSGAYPMTLIQVVKETGASVIGIDVDDNALKYGKKVVDFLAPEAQIEITDQTVNELRNISDVTHIIFSSTVPIKYEILDELYAITNEKVIVSMRFGNHMKSLFNYPKEDVNPNKWECVETILQTDQIFDIAIYKKSTKRSEIHD
ncbi:staphylopine biosynthesis enzyme CntL [Mammaliicoccus stepanovicii]|uniref:Nicotianamine synthase-like enzyme n=1 Tax=Mammaliicoccus stepanovicii TaxID=643214 RepID=A0A239Z262_9STAP|nr:staphylopine biosynthesis enzyme CntL [Mammaliicoccus stepanovicii]PNZ78066.1 SAM-dependent methyltransferase [Mammaliicoccus stepanovicii]GGI40271.1 hypothetical protein GCM10010896_07540 [Mammaliicoccus stepanovicii]SNV65132.1 nicotianamine synthase-like enzyme [Mammaliicoccus stepanovicii]